MPTLTASALNSAAEAIKDDMASGTLEIGTAGMAAVLVTFPLNATAGVVAANVITLNGFPQTVAAAGAGTAAEARIRDSVSGDVVTGLTVGTGGTDVILDNTNIAAAQDVTIDSGTITIS